MPRAIAHRILISAPTLALVAACTQAPANNDERSSTATGRPAPTSTAGQTASHSTEWQSGDPSCAAPGRVRFANLPRALQVPEQKGWQWFGAQNLWVDPPPVSNVENSTRVKFGSVTLDDHGRLSDAAGPPTVVAERVDGSGSVEGSVGGYASVDVGAESLFFFWPTVIDFPSAGCWLITETFQDTTLRFLMRVRA